MSEKGERMNKQKKNIFASHEQYLVLLLSTVT